MSDPIGTTASAVTILHRVVATTRWLMQQFGSKPSKPHKHDGPHDFKLMPVSFMINLVHSIPFVELGYYVINYRGHPLTLTEAKVTELRLSGGQPIENIPLAQGFSVAPKSSFMVFFRRNLLDSEARVLSQQNISPPVNATFSLIARAKCGRREYTYRPVSSMSIEGLIYKSTSA